MKRPDNLQAYKTLTTIGLTFGASAQQVGKILTQQGYREPKTLKPTGLAVEKKLVHCSYIPTGQQFWLWKAKDVDEVMQNVGWVKLPKEDIQSNIIIDQVVKLLKKAVSHHGWHVKKAYKLACDFAPRASSKHLQDLLSAVEKNAHPFSSEFEKRYATIILQKKLQEETQEIAKERLFAPKSKM